MTSSIDYSVSYIREALSSGYYNLLELQRMLPKGVILVPIKEDSRFGNQYTQKGRLRFVSRGRTGATIRSRLIQQAKDLRIIIKK